VVRWTTETGQTYRVLGSTNAGFLGYDILAAGISGTAEQVASTNALPEGATGSPAFYRVKTE